MTQFTIEPEDLALLSRFNRQILTREDWTHAMHLRIGWIHVRCYDVQLAGERLRQCIRRLNDANGVVNSASSGYHETLTRLWLCLIDAADADDRRRVATSAAFLDDHPELLDPKLPLRFFSKDRLMGAAARKSWVEPDLQTLPPRT